MEFFLSRSSRLASNSELSAAVSKGQVNDRIRIQLKIIIIKSPSRKFLIDAKFIENFNYLQIFTQHEHKIPQNELHPWNILPNGKEEARKKFGDPLCPCNFNFDSFGKTHSLLFVDMLSHWTF